MTEFVDRGDGCVEALFEWPPFGLIVAAARIINGQPVEKMTTSNGYTYWLANEVIDGKPVYRDKKPAPAPQGGATETKR